MNIRLIDIALYIFVVAVVVVGFYFNAKLPRNIEVRYNCELAEISPDFPAEVKQKCRELRAKQ